MLCSQMLPALAMLWGGAQAFLAGRLVRGCPAQHLVLAKGSSSVWAHVSLVCWSESPASLSYALA